MEAFVYTVSQLTGLIKSMLQESFPSVQLKGEISNFKANSTGHLYFSLKDSTAQISAVMFRGQASRLNFQPKDGMLVQVKGKISVYEAQGRYQIIIDSMTQAGLGDIMEMIEAPQARTRCRRPVRQCPEAAPPPLPCHNRCRNESDRGSPPGHPEHNGAAQRHGKCYRLPCSGTGGRGR